MNISKFLKITSAVFIILSVLVGGSIYFFNNGIANERNAVTRQTEMLRLAADLITATNYKTDKIRAYVEYGLESSYTNYMTEVNETKTQEKIFDRLTELNISEESMDYLQNALSISKNLLNMEMKTLDLYKEGDIETAKFMVNNSSYQENIRAMMSYLELFQKKINEEAEAYTAEIMVQTNFLFKVIIITSILLVAFILFTFIMMNKKFQGLPRYPLK